MLLTTFSTIGVTGLQTANKTVKNADNEDFLDQENDEYYDGNFVLGASGKNFAAQSFVPTYDIITKLCISKGGSTSGSAVGADSIIIQIMLREELTSNNIAYTTKEVSLLPGTYDWVEFDIPDTTVEPGKTYYMLWGTMNYHSGVGWRATGWKYDGDPYSSGQAFCKRYNEWEYSSFAKDMHFKTYGRNGDDGNNQPEEFELISYPSSGKINEDLTFELKTSDPDDDQVKYKFELRKTPENRYWVQPDTIISSCYESSEINSATITIEEPAVYWMKVTALDEHNAESPNSMELGPIYVSNYQNSAPNTPLLSGEDFGQIIKEYEYTAVSWDCDKDNINYEFDWGVDGIEIRGPYESGEQAIIGHRWMGLFVSSKVKVRAIDEEGLESPWSEPINIYMSRSRVINNPLIQKAISSFMEIQKLFLK
jgi:hypothetical protein